MIDRVFMECVNEIDAAQAGLRKLKQITCRIAAGRKTISTGQACLQQAVEARRLLGQIRDHLAAYEARLQRLAEGVDSRAGVP